MAVSNKRICDILLDYLVLTIGCFVFALAWETFMIPNGMSAGGTMGLCTVIQYATGGFIKAQYLYFAINAFLIILASWAMGIGFGFKTIYCIVMSSAMMELVAGVPALHSVGGEFFFVQERVLIPIIAGALEGLGIGLTIQRGGSTGGTDIIALMVNKYWPISLSTVFFITDIATVCLLLFLPDKSFNDIVYGITEIVTFTLIIDLVVVGKKSSYQLLVFSSKYQEIADHIINVMDRGVTVLNATGWYTKHEKNVLLILINQKELHGLSKVIKQLDPRAFMSVSPTHNVYGEGFDEIKSGITTKKDNTKNG